MRCDAMAMVKHKGKLKELERSTKLEVKAATRPRQKDDVNLENASLSGCPKRFSRLIARQEFHGCG